MGAGTWCGLVDWGREEGRYEAFTPRVFIGGSGAEWSWVGEVGSWVGVRLWLPSAYVISPPRGLLARERCSVLALTGVRLWCLLFSLSGFLLEPWGRPNGDLSSPGRRVIYYYGGLD